MSKYCSFMQKCIHFRVDRCLAILIAGLMPFAIPASSISDDDVAVLSKECQSGNIASCQKLATIAKKGKKEWVRTEAVRARPTDLRGR
jgi:hypothetical protein